LKFFWKNKTVLVTGAAGFVGSHVVAALVKKGASVRAVYRPGKIPERLSSVIQKIEYCESNLEIDNSIYDICKNVEIVIHLAAQLHPRGKHDELFANNIIINNNVQNAAIAAGVKHFMLMSTVGVYPDSAESPIIEDEGLKKEPEKNQRGYGWAKRAAEIQAQLTEKKFGIEVSILRPSNVYGPQDNFEGDNLFVIPSLINRIMKGEDPLIIQGDGKHLRSFLFVEDLVRAILLSVEKNPGSAPMNIAPNTEISIRDLVFLLLEVSGKKPKIYFNSAISGGRYQRSVNTERASTALGFDACTPIKIGLQKTLYWYRGHFNF